MQTIKSDDYKTVKKPVEHWPKVSKEIRYISHNKVLLKLSCAQVDLVKNGDPASAGLGWGLQVLLV